MNKNLNVDYVEGYVDATKQMTKAIDTAITNQKTDLIEKINEIVTVLHKQNLESYNMVSELTKVTIKEFLSNNEKKEQSFVDLLEELKEVLGDNVEIVVIKEGR